MKKSNAMIQQILALNKQGVSIRKISRALKLSRNTVRGYIRDADQPAIEVQEGSPGVQRWDQVFP